MLICIVKLGFTTYIYNLFMFAVFLFECVELPFFYQN